MFTTRPVSNHTQSRAEQSAELHCIELHCTELSGAFGAVRLRSSVCCELAVLYCTVPNCTVLYLYCASPVRLECAREVRSTPRRAAPLRRLPSGRGALRASFPAAHRKRPIRPFFSNVHCGHRVRDDLEHEDVVTNRWNVATAAAAPVVNSQHGAVMSTGKHANTVLSAPLRYAPPSLLFISLHSAVPPAAAE